MNRGAVDGGSPAARLCDPSVFRNKFEDAASAPQTGAPAATLQGIGIALSSSVTPFRAPSRPVR